MGIKLAANSPEIVGSILQYLGIDIKQVKANFDSRLRVQKVIYLLMLHRDFKGMLGFGFNFYLRGPYSSDLAHVYFSLSEDKDYPLLKLPKGAMEYLNYIKDFELKDLELVASTIEVIKWSPGAKKKDVIKRVAELKPGFEKTIIERAYQEAQSMKEKFNLELQ
ncbi:MAG: hypothetical protein QXG05_05070 [Nitrososphaerota archaeon]